MRTPTPEASYALVSPLGEEVMLCYDFRILRKAYANPAQAILLCVSSSNPYTKINLPSNERSKAEEIKNFDASIVDKQEMALVRTTVFIDFLGEH